MGKYTKEFILTIIGLIISFSGYTLKDFIQNDYIMTNPFTYQSVLTSLLVAVCIHFYFKIKDLTEKTETQNQKLEDLESFLTKKTDNIDSDIYRILSHLNLPQSKG